MNVSNRILSHRFLQNKAFKRIVTFSTKPQPEAVASQPQTVNVTSNTHTDNRKPLVPKYYCHVYPEFLPDPKVQWRNAVREKLERLDMLERRRHIDLPEFYVGSILAVTSSDPHAAGKVSRFVGICIHRERCGLRARFILRNVIDHQGVEVLYELYDPTIQKVEVLRLEKRLDDHLFYLRDALPEYSTFDVDMEAEQYEEGKPVAVNDIKVELRPRPWLERWERQSLRGVANIDQYTKPKHRRSALAVERPWEKYDMMKQYRATIPEEEQQVIFAELHTELHSMELQRKRNRRKRTFMKPAELA